MNNQTTKTKADLEGVTHYQLFVEWYRIPNHCGDDYIRGFSILEKTHPTVIRSIESQGYWNDCNIYYVAVCQIPSTHV